MRNRLSTACALLAAIAIGAPALSAAGSTVTCDFRTRNGVACSGAGGITTATTIPIDPKGRMPPATAGPGEATAAPSQAAGTPEPRTARILPGTLVRDRD